jgi:hypothetical protein
VHFRLPHWLFLKCSYFIFLIRCHISRCIFITTPFRLNRRSCLLSESGNASIPTFDLFSQDGEDVLLIYLLIAIFSDWKHRWRNTIYIQEIEIRSYVISLGDEDFIFSAQKIFVTYLRNTKKENFKNVMFLE